MKNCSSDSTPFKMTDTFCSTVDSVKKERSNLVRNRSKLWTMRNSCVFFFLALLTGILVSIDTFGSTKLWNESSFTNTWPTQHMHTIWFDGAKWSCWIRHGWRLVWRNWTVRQTIASRPLSSKWIATVDNTCKFQRKLLSCCLNNHFSCYLLLHLYIFSMNYILYLFSMNICKLQFSFMRILIYKWERSVLMK